MRDSIGSPDRRTSDSVRVPAGVRWNEFGNGNSAGAARSDSSGRVEWRVAPISRKY
jgi:hypothetical protein